MSKTIKISRKNYNHYKKIKTVMDELVMLDNMSVKIPYDTFAKSVNEIKNKVNINHLSFKDFIAEDNDDITVDVPYQEYEQLISAKTAFNAIKILDKKSSKKMDWNSYGIALDAIIESYNEKETV